MKTEDHISDELDLVGLVIPLCLLQLKRTLSTMSKGDVLRVRVEDPFVLTSIRRLVEHSPDQVIASQQEESFFCLHILKG